jgi:hypothetical protein
MPESSSWLRWQVLSMVLAAAGCEGTLVSGLALEPLPEALAPASEGPCAFVQTPSVDTRNELCPTGTYSGDVRLVNGRFEALQGCVRVTGSIQVELSGSDQLRALDALEVLDGSLIITAASSIDSTLPASRGLEQLRCISGDLSLSREAPVKGLNKLREVGGSLTIAAGALHAEAELSEQAASIRDLTALSRLQSVTGQLSIGPLSGEGVLPSLDGLDQLRSVGALSIQNLPELEDLQGLGLLERAGHVDIRACNGLRDLYGLDTLREVGGRLRLVNNAALGSLAGTPALRELDELVIDGNASLTSLRGAASQVTRLTALTVEHNGRLKTLDGADALARTRNLFVSDNAQLVRLGRFPRLRSLDLLEVADNPKLTELGEFPALTGSDELELILRNNTRLPKLTGLERVAQAYNVSITGCHELTSLTGLRIKEIRNLLVLTNNSALTTLEGLDSLREAGFVKIQANASLVDLSGLAGLRGSSAAIELRNNFALTNTQMLAHFASVYLENDAP